QQQFLSSLIRKIKSNGTLTHPVKMWKLANAATKALTVDSAIASAAALESLAQDISSVGTKNITFTTVPVLDDPLDANRLVLKQPAAQQSFAMVAADNSLPATGKKPKAAADPAAGVVTPGEVRITVEDGSGVLGQAQSTLNWMQNTKKWTRTSNG